MKKYLLSIFVSMMCVAALAGCSQAPAESENTTEQTPAAQTESSNKAEGAQTQEASTVKIKDIHGEVEVPKNPTKIVSLDNRTFDTLNSWGVKLQAVPKDVMPADNAYVKDESVANVGNHREPNLEAIAAADPEVVIVGQRFAKYYEDIKKLVPNAVVVDFSFDVSNKDGKAAEDLVAGFSESTLALGQIFDKEKEAQEIVDKFNKSIEDVKANYKPENKVMALVVSGGNIGYSAPGSGRVWGPMFDLFGFSPALQVENSSNDHKGDDVSVEAIAQSNPDTLLVLDRDAATQDSKSQPATEVIEKSPALAQVNAVKNGDIYYAPSDTYTNESIQTYTKIFEELAEQFKK